MVMGSKTQVSNLFLKRKSRTKIEGSKQKKINLKNSTLRLGGCLREIH